MRKHFAVAAAAVALATGAWTTLMGELTMTADSKVWVDGTSTVRSYTCKAAAVEGVVVTTAPLATLEDAATVVESVTLTIDVDKIDCDNGTMNNHMKKALKLEQNPMLVYTATSLTTATDAEGAVSITLAGELSMAGQTKPLELQGRASRGEDGVIRYQGEVGFDMTEWGVKPPSLMFGTLKVHPPVVVGFDVTLADG